MKNIQVIDGADNTAYDIFSCTDEEHLTIFKEDGQNIEFVEDLIERIGQDAAAKLLGPIWTRPVRKQDVSGIHGTLFYELRDKKASFYPNKKEKDLDKDGRGWVHG